MDCFGNDRDLKLETLAKNLFIYGNQKKFLKKLETLSRKLEKWIVLYIHMFLKLKIKNLIIHLNFSLNATKSKRSIYWTRNFKKILNAIHNGGKIEYKKFNLEKHGQKLKNSKKILNWKERKKFFVKNHFFWELALKRYKNLLTISVKKKDQKSKKDKYDVNYQEISKSLGYNPTLLSLIIFENKIKKF